MAPDSRTFSAMDTQHIDNILSLLTPAEVDRARHTGRLVGTILQTLRERTAVGTNLLQIDRWAKQMIEDAGADSCYVDYAPRSAAARSGTPSARPSTTPSCTA